MIIRCGLILKDAVKENELTKALISAALKIHDLSLSGDTENDTLENRDIDIAYYPDDFDLLLKNFDSLDMIFVSYDFLKTHQSDLQNLFLKNPWCMSIPVGNPKEEICKYLLLRPAGHLDGSDDQTGIMKYSSMCFDMLRNSDNVIQISTKKGDYSVSISAVAYFQSDLKYVMCVSRDGTVYKKLGKMDDIVAPYSKYFFRVHQSFAVNYSVISVYDKTMHEIITNEGVRIPVSRKYTKAVSDYMQNISV
ncbi:MAG: LytTR family transcriptional regulator [Clostridia bacterium]|nr:LytTR family transcriptional regulator [Clostridia bacterium]